MSASDGVFAGSGVDAGLGDGDDVQRAVEPAVAGAVEAMSRVSARGCFEGADAGVAGEPCLVGEPQAIGSADGGQSSPSKPAGRDNSRVVPDPGDFARGNAALLRPLEIRWTERFASNPKKARCFTKESMIHPW